MAGVRPCCALAGSSGAGFSLGCLQEDARKQAEAENDEERKMREYRAQLDAERAAKLARGTNHAPEKSEKKSERLHSRLVWRFLMNKTSQLEVFGSVEKLGVR